MLGIANNTLRGLLPDRLIRFLRELWYNHLDGHAKKSYSQQGEDVILGYFFENQLEGFYVDVGAHHPKRFSNTYLFYKKGWRGMNIDAMPGSMALFDKLRPRDINLEIAVADHKQHLTFYVFDDPALSGFAEDLSKKREQEDHYRIVGREQIETHTLKEILDNYLPHGQTIDFLSVDVEGLDMLVLKSNDWERYRPKIVLVEAFESALEKIIDGELNAFLKSKGYYLFAKSVTTLIFTLEN
jgi:FkbM family methyltransferase